MADTAGFTLFDTAIGWCGIAWSARGVTRFALPDASPDITRARLSRASAELEPPPAIAAAIAIVVRHIAGERVELESIEVDLDGVPDFHREVYAALRRVPAGRTVTYGALAHSLGKPGAARAIGQAMGKNPIPVIVPCHRVLAANAPGGFSAPGGVTTKAKLLAAEGFTLGLQAKLPF